MATSNNSHHLTPLCHCFGGCCVCLQLQFETCEMHTRANCLHKHYSTQIIYCRSCTNCVSPNSLAMLEALPYFEGRLLILVPNIRQGKCFFSVMLCCMGSAVYLAGRHVKKSRKLDLKILCSEAHLLHLKQINSYKYY